MKSFMLDVAWWSLTALLVPYILTLFVLSIIFIWCNPILFFFHRLFRSLETWKSNLFEAKNDYTI